MQVILLGAVLVGVSASAWLVERLEFPTLRWLEGYWPSWMRPLKHCLSHAQWARIEAKRKKWHELCSKKEGLELHDDHLSVQDREEYIMLDVALMRAPVSEQDCMPTRLGNILRAAERKPSNRYGLDAVICWPRLWLLLPDGIKKELTEARAALDMQTRLWIWSTLFIVWSYWTIWALPIGVLAAAMTYRLMLHAAVVYGELLEATYDLHRPALYQALRWPLPQNPKDEQSKGKALTEYLWRGSDANMPSFSSPDRPH